MIATIYLFRDDAEYVDHEGAYLGVIGPYSIEYSGKQNDFESVVDTTGETILQIGVAKHWRAGNPDHLVALAYWTDPKGVQHARETPLEFDSNVIDFGQYRAVIEK